MAPLSREFQSALPLRGATPVQLAIDCWAGFQSALPLRGATAGLHADLGSPLRISIRAPLAGSDHVCRARDPDPMISIRAPLAGSDAVTAGSAAVPVVISIRAPLAGSDRGGCRM